MSLVQFLADKEGAELVIEVLRSELPVALEVLDALEPAIPGLCAVLQKHGIDTVAGVNVAEFVQALADKEDASEGNN